MLQGFLGRVGYYLQYIPSLARTARSLHWLTGKGKSEHWAEGVESLRVANTAPVLGYPDPIQLYILDTDASQCRVGVALS